MNYKTKIKSDHYDEVKAKQEEPNMEMPMPPEMVPVDLYGKRVFKNKNDADNYKNVSEDIKEFYDLDGTKGLKGGE